MAPSGVSQPPDTSWLLGLHCYLCRTQTVVRGRTQAWSGLGQPHSGCIHSLGSQFRVKGRVEGRMSHSAPPPYSIPGTPQHTSPSTVLTSIPLTFWSGLCGADPKTPQPAPRRSRCPSALALLWAVLLPSGLSLTSPAAASYWASCTVPSAPSGFRMWPHGHFLPAPVIFRCLPGIHPCEATLEQKLHPGVPRASPSAP